MNRIKQLREMLSMTQEELGKKLNVKKAAVAKYENGTIENIKSASIKKMSEIFGVTPAYILGWSDDPFDLTPDEERLLEDFRLLNPMGKAEALKRVKELSQLLPYTYDIVDDIKPVAAHDNGATAAEMGEDMARAVSMINLRKKAEHSKKTEK